METTIIKSSVWNKKMTKEDENDSEYYKKYHKTYILVTILIAHNTFWIKMVFYTLYMKMNSLDLTTSTVQTLMVFVYIYIYKYTV